MRVEVYFNLHKKLFSIRALEGPGKGRVIKHTPTVGLLNATFTSQKAGREKVRREGRKNVHAFVRGDLFYCRPTHFFFQFERPIRERGARVTYNPYTDDSFVIDGVERTPVYEAERVSMSTAYGVYALEPK